MSALGTSSQRCTTGSSRTLRQEKETKGVQIREEEVKPPLLSEMILYTENPKDPTK